MAKHNELGKRGEKLATAFLEEKGYEILDENWIHGKSELDIIAYIRHTIVFVEVKTRSSVAYGRPEEFVDAAKQRQMQQAAQAYIDIMEYEGEIRFDVIALFHKKDNTFEINHIEDAFWPYE